MTKKAQTRDSGENSSAAEKKVHHFEKAVEDSVGDFERLTSEISGRIENKEEALRKELDETNAALAGIKQDLDKGAAELRKRVWSSVGWARKRVARLEVLCYVVAFASVLVYFGVLSWLNIAIGIDSIALVVIAFILAILVGYSARVAKNDLSGDQYTINQYLTEIWVAISSLAGRRLRSHESFEGINQALSSASSLAKRVIISTREFNPALKAMYEQASFLSRLRNFKHTLRNALRFYALKIDSESEACLSSFQSMSDSESEWLAGASKELSEKLETSPHIISLFYYAYIDNAEGLRNSWQKIRSDAGETAHLARIMLTTVRTKDIDPGSPRTVELGTRIIEKLDTFDPRTFGELLRSFQVDLLMLKSSVSLALAHFGFKPDAPQQSPYQKAIADFMPGDTDPTKWADELLTALSKLIQVPKDIIMLFVQENSGEKDQAQKTLAKIKQDRDKTRELLTIMMSNGVLRIPDRYASSTDSVLEVALQHISEHHFVSIENILVVLSAYFAELDNQKDRLLQAMSAYNVKVPPTLRKRFESSYLPTTISVDGMIDFLSGNLGTRKDFLALFYYEFAQETQNLQTAFSNVLNRNLTKGLASLLIDLGFIESSQITERDTEVDNLTSVIGSFQNFKLSSIQSAYQAFRDLLTWSKNLSAFCSEHELAPARFDVDFPWLLKLLKGKTSIRSYEQLRIVCNEIVAQSNLRDKSQKVIHASVLATLVLFFKSQEDSRLYEACKDATINDLAPEILYHFIIRREAQLRREKVTLKAVIEEILTSTTIAYPWIEDVKDVFALGRVPERISDVVSVRFETHQKEIEEIEHEKKELSEVLKELETSLRQFFQVELKEDVILQLLRMQVISAYLITIPSGKPVISQIIETEMPKLCEEFAQKDLKFSDMLLIQKGTGKYTRIGIVPVGMTFEEFNNRFSQVFQEAVGEYCQQNLGQTRADFSANIIRIFPVEATFKVVGGDPTTSTVVEHPARIIRELFLNRVSSEANLALMATARVNDPEKLALKKVVVSLFNDYTSLWLLLKDKIEPLIGTRVHLRDAFETKAFDKELLARMQSRTMTELAQKVHTIASTPKGKQEMKQTIEGHITGMLKAFQIRMDPRERETLSNEILERLHRIGLILTTR
jgi:hypothetical protein